MHRQGRGRGSNPWGPKQPVVSKAETKTATAEQRFNKARQELEASVKKHDIVDSSEEEEENEDSGSILEKVLGMYEQLGGGDLGRTKEFLNNSMQSGAGVCLICIASVKRADAIWSCAGCYDFFHIVCIQKWARDNLFQQKQAMEEMPVFMRRGNISWGCPKCRKEFSENDVPSRYWCFCGKAEDPPHHPWLVPHSCGDKCDKPLVPECGHRCLLLCHPGPCPPCPKTVKTQCYCGKAGPAAKRCSDKHWSCMKPCGRSLLCNKHQCKSVCHSGACPPCPQQSQQKCDCGKETALRPCSEPCWKCDKVCNKPFPCGHHKCESTCHEGACGNSGDCPLALRTCPCGKTVSAVECFQDAPTCKDTCGKLLDCGVHRCQLKCHKDNCACLEIVTKVCRCGLHKKEVPCGKVYTCETKCKKTKSCLKHPCNRKCCDGACGGCEKPCGRTLPCGTHKCLSVCHRGPCYPCPQTATVRCRCGSTFVTVPCGRERKTRPPKCKKYCTISPDCHHPSRDPHRCHFGDCPPCKQVCGQMHESCGHACSSVCHTAVWLKVEETRIPAGPWEVFEPTYRRQTLPCPACTVPVPVTCIGGHETSQLPCSSSAQYSCGRQCGRMLTCGNHSCELQCHDVDEECEDCEVACERPPAKGCSHPCPRPCHPDPCARPCRELIKVQCHCRITTLHVECFRLTEGRLDESLCCGNKCPNNLPCGHKCKANCHPGACPDPEGCRKKTKVTCPCGHLKKDVPCDVLRRGDAMVACTDGCETKKKEMQIAKELEEAKRQEEAERRNREELEKFEKKFHGKKKVRERKRLVEDDDQSFLLKYWLPLALGVVSVAVIGYFLLA